MLENVNTGKLICMISFANSTYTLHLPLSKIYDLTTIYSAKIQQKKHMQGHMFHGHCTFHQS